MTTYVEPTSLDDVCRLLGEDEDAKLLAGGTALVLMMRFGLIEPSRLVSLRAIDGLTGVTPDGAGVRLGARTTLHDVARAPEVRAVAPSLAYACSRVGNTRIRNIATIGGNLAEADYASDPPSVLVSLDATCTAYGSSGPREIEVRDLLVDFYTTSLEPSEVITSVSVPAPDPGVDRRTSYRKFVSRSSEDRPCVGVAARADHRDGELVALSVVVGAVTSVPQRFDDVTAPLLGGRLDDSSRASVASAYAEAIDPLDDARGAAWYRRRMIEVFVRRALEDVSHT